MPQCISKLKVANFVYLYCKYELFLVDRRCRNFRMSKCWSFTGFNFQEWFLPQKFEHENFVPNSWKWQYQWRGIRMLSTNLCICCYHVYKGNWEATVEKCLHHATKTPPLATVVTLVLTSGICTDSVAVHKVWLLISSSKSVENVTKWIFRRKFNEQKNSVASCNCYLRELVTCCTKSLIIYRRQEIPFNVDPAWATELQKRWRVWYNWMDVPDEPSA